MRQCPARARLELDPGTSLVREGENWRVPPAGKFLGLRCHEPNFLDRQRGDVWPVVVEVAPGSPAALARVERGDRLRAIAGVPCALPARDWRRRLWAHERVALDLDRNGREIRVVLEP